MAVFLLKTIFKNKIISEKNGSLNNLKWQVVYDEPACALTNMSRDKKLFCDFEIGKIPPTIRIYSWIGPAITYGYRIKPEQFFNLEEIKKKGISLAARPTGGGIVFHKPQEITFAITLPRRHFFKSILEPYFFTSDLVLSFLKSFGIKAEVKERNFKRKCRIENHFCFEEPAPYEIVLNGKKIVGIAQRVFKNSFCQQGTIQGVEKFGIFPENFCYFLKEDLNF